MKSPLFQRCARSCDGRGQARGALWPSTPRRSWRDTGQYAIMGNAQVMTAKVVWDWACYWGVTALLFFHNNKLFDMAWATSVRETLKRFNLLYSDMQQFFQQSTNLTPEPQMDRFINILSFSFLEELYYGLTADFDDDALRRQLIKNVALLEAVAAECKESQTMSNIHGTFHFGATAMFA